MIQPQLYAFPLTPLVNNQLDETAFRRLLDRIVEAGISHLCVLGSTGNYAYLSPEARLRIAEIARQHCPKQHLMVNVTALTTQQAIQFAQHAERIGADGLLLAPQSYQMLREVEVFRLFEQVSLATNLPICIYDNPSTTHFTFTSEFYAKLAALPNVSAVKIPTVSDDLVQAKAEIHALKQALPNGFEIGISGDWQTYNGLNAGCNHWYSVLAGTFPKTAKQLFDLTLVQDPQAETLNQALKPLWDYFQQYGSLRTMATLAEIQGLVQRPCLPEPLLNLEGEISEEVKAMLDWLE